MERVRVLGTPAQLLRNESSREVLGSGKVEDGAGVAQLCVPLHSIAQPACPVIVPSSRIRCSARVRKQGLPAGTVML